MGTGQQGALLAPIGACPGPAPLSLSIGPDAVRDLTRQHRPRLHHHVVAARLWMSKEPGGGTAGDPVGVGAIGPLGQVKRRQPVVSLPVGRCCLFQGSQPGLQFGDAGILLLLLGQQAQNRGAAAVQADGDPTRKDPLKVQRFVRSARAAAPRPYHPEGNGPFDWADAGL